MSKYFRVFKFDRSNTYKSSILKYYCSARIFLAHFLNVGYDLRNGNLYIASGWGSKDSYPYINFYKSNYDFRNLKGKWCSIIVNDISMESKPNVLEELYNELGSLENPEEDQIACYTFLINRLTNG